MLFGLKNALAYFQQIIDDTLAPLPRKYYVTYMDNILIFLKNKDDHEKN